MFRFALLLLPLLLATATAYGQARRLVVAPPGSATCGDTITVGVYGSFPEQIIGLQYTVQWDTTRLQFLNYTANDLNGAPPILGTSDVDTGFLAYVWIDFSSTGATLDSTLLLEVTLIVRNGASTTAVVLGNFPTSTEATDVAFNTILPPDIALLHDSISLSGGLCGGNGPFAVSARYLTETGAGVENVRNTLHWWVGSNPTDSLRQWSNADGQVTFNNALPYAANFTLTPYLNSDPTNGITTYDLYLINRYILGLLPLSPYRQIAADANRSNSVTSTDIVMLRRLILGLESGFPNNTSWRFIPEAYVFPNPLNAFVAPFPETTTATLVATTPAEQRFVGVKIGDINFSAISNNLLALDERSTSVVHLAVSDRWVHAGEEFEGLLATDMPCLALQGTFELEGAVVLGVQVGADSNSDFAALHEQGRAVSLAWETHSENAENVQLTLHCRAERAGWLSQFLSVGSWITPASATLIDGRSGQLSLQFTNPLTPEKEPLTLTLAPNPWSAQTQLEFWSPLESTVNLDVYDVAGRVLFSQKINAARGYNTVNLRREQLPLVSALLFCRISGETGSVTRPMWVE